MTVREDRFGNVVQASRPFSSQAMTITAVSQQSALFSVNKDRPIRNTTGAVQNDVTNMTRHVRLVATVNCWVAFGNNPVAGVRSPLAMYLPAGLPEYFWVRSGEQIAVIQDSVGGFFYITELHN